MGSVPICIVFTLIHWNFEFFSVQIKVSINLLISYKAIVKSLVRLVKHTKLCNF